MLQQRLFGRKTHSRFPVRVIYLSPEFLHECPEEVGVDVLAQLVEHEPVAGLALGQDVDDRLPHILVIGGTSW